MYAIFPRCCSQRQGMVRGTKRKRETRDWDFHPVFSPGLGTDSTGIEEQRMIDSIVGKNFHAHIYDSSRLIHIMSGQPIEQ